MIPLLRKYFLWLLRMPSTGEDKTRVRGRLAVFVSFVLLAVACSSGGRAEPGSSVARQLAGPKRITMAFPREMDLAHHLGQDRPILRTLVNPGLSVIDAGDTRRPT